MLQEIKTLLLPAKSELFLFGAVALFLLVAQNISRYWSYFSGVKFEDVKNASSIGGQIEFWVLEKEAGIDPRIADFIIWMLLGMIAISVILFIQSNLRNANDERDLIEHMKSPSSRVHELEVYALKIAVRVGAFIGLLVYFRVFTGWINDSLSDLFFISSLSLNDPKSWLWLVVSLVLFTVSIYMFAIFIRIMALKTRIFD